MHARHSSLLRLMAIMGALVLAPACGGSTGGGPAIPCSDENPECPANWTCDLAQGRCVAPPDGGSGANPCSVGESAVPGCPCREGLNVIDCTGYTLPDGILGGCVKGQASCDPVTEKYGACVALADLQCSSVGVTPDAFIPDEENSDQVEVNEDGELVLNPDEKQKVEFGFLWVANTGENTVSKIDIDTGKEVARYASVRNSGGLGLHAVPVGGFTGSSASGGACGNCPSRTAIDFKGDAFVANRAHDGPGSKIPTVTKYANKEEDCKDYNMNGVIETSRDVNNDGVIDKDNTDPLNPEFLGENDECILWTRTLGQGSGSNARALAIDAGGIDGENGNVWVGLYATENAVLLSGDTGLPVVGTDGQNVVVRLDSFGGQNFQFRPYGAAADSSGNVWFTGLDEGDVVYLARVSSVSYTLTGLWPVPDNTDGCSRGYGIAVDVDGRVWLAGIGCNDIKAFQPSNETWIRREGPVSTRGIAPDINGNIWVALTGGKVVRYVIADIAAQGNAAVGTEFNLAAGQPTLNNTIGVGLDKNGACWAVSRNDNSTTGIASRINPNGTIDHFPVGKNPYTYSDFTGFGLATVVRPSGFFRGILQGCASGPSAWTSLTWIETEPDGTSVRVRFRVANTLAELASAPWFGPYDAPPVDLVDEAVPQGSFFQFEIQLSSTNPGVTPIFKGLDLNFTCPGSGGGID